MRTHSDSTQPTIISVYNHKGGVGKSTTTYNFGYTLAQTFKQRVLLIDADSQCNLTDLFLEGNRLIIRENHGSEKGLETNEENAAAEPEQTETHEPFDLENSDTSSTMDETEMQDSAIDFPEEDPYESSDDEQVAADEGYERIYGEEQREVVNNLKKFCEHFLNPENDLDVSHVELTASAIDPNFYLLPGDVDLYEVEEYYDKAMHEAKTGGGNYLSSPGKTNEIIRKLAHHNNIDIVLIDHNPGGSPLTRVFFMLSDYFIVPSFVDFFSHRAMRSLSKKLPEWSHQIDDFREGSEVMSKRRGRKYFMPKAPQYLGAIFQRYKQIRSSRNQLVKMVTAYAKWLDKIAKLLGNELTPALESENMFGNIRARTEYIGIPEFHSEGLNAQEKGVPIAHIDSSQQNDIAIRVDFARLYMRLAQCILINLGKNPIAYSGATDIVSLDYYRGSIKKIEKRVYEAVPSERNQRIEYRVLKSYPDYTSSDGGGKKRRIYHRLPIPCSLDELERLVLSKKRSLELRALLAHQMIKIALTAENNDYYNLIPADEADWVKTFKLLYFKNQSRAFNEKHASELTTYLEEKLNGHDPEKPRSISLERLKTAEKIQDHFLRQHVFSAVIIYYLKQLSSSTEPPQEFQFMFLKILFEALEPPLEVQTWKLVENADNEDEEEEGLWDDDQGMQQVKPDARFQSKQPSPILYHMLFNPRQERYQIIEPIGETQSDRFTRARSTSDTLEQDRVHKRNRTSLFPNPLSKTQPPIDIQGLEYQSLPGDGHCLYWAVALYLGQDVQLLRNIVAGHIEANLDDFVGFLQEKDVENIDAYLEAIREKREWAGDVEIYGLMRVLDRPIVIVNSNEAAQNRVHLNDMFDDLKNLPEARSPIFVYYNGGDEANGSGAGHYDALTLTGEVNSQEILSHLLSPPPESARLSI